MKKRNMTLVLFLLALTFSVSPVLACSTFNAEAVKIELCGSLASGNFSYEFNVSGIRVARGEMTPFYITENGHREDDNSFLMTAFWIPSTPTLARFKVRVLKQSREDSSGFFGPAGTVIYAQAIWRIDHAPECLIPDLNNMGSNCWDESAWRPLGHL